MRFRRMRYAATVLALSVTPLVGAATSHAADETGPPQPEAVVMTRICEQNGALVAMSNLGGGSVTFTILVDNEAAGQVTVGAGSHADHLVPILEDQTVSIQVTADGMAPVAATRTRDCEAAQPAGADTTTGATDPVDAVPAGTPPPEPVPPVAVAGAAEGPTDTTTGSGDSTLAPATDPVAPSGTLPFTGAPVALTWLALAGVGLLLVGAIAWRPRRERVRRR